MNAATYYGELIDWILGHVTDLDMFIVQSVVTCGALFWLLHRAWLTLWKPVPELISILGVEVPDAPIVSLAGIKADVVTLHWTKPGVNRPVVKYLIQVNGVNVGESSRSETAITVIGLKPGHFYNVRVIAVGSNNFQAGSRVIRLRTYGRDGRPELINGRTPPNPPPQDQPNNALADSSDESAIRNYRAGSEAAASPDEATSLAREPSFNGGLRRNAGSRRHSPSITAADHVAITSIISSKHPGDSMQQLTEKFETIRRETEEAMDQIARDADEFRSQMIDLSKEKEDKKQALKEKEEASERLKKEVHYTEKANRQAQNKKTQKEKTLKDKAAERRKMQEDMSRWRKEIDEMKRERESWREEREKLSNAKEVKSRELQGAIRKHQFSLNGLEEEIQVKGQLIEKERRKSPGSQDDNGSQERDAAEKQRDLEWEAMERDLVTRLHAQDLLLRRLDIEYRNAQANYAAFSARQTSNPMMYHGNSSGVDFDPTGGQGKPKSRRSRNRKSRTSTGSSPAIGYPVIESPFSGGYNNLNPAPSGFAIPSYFGMSSDTVMVPLSQHMSNMNEADMHNLTAGVPLSPTAASLLPADIFCDEEPSSPRASSTRSLGPALFANLNPSTHDNDPQSPGSSSRSASLMSSPQTSSHNLAIFGVSGRDYGAENDRGSLHSPRADFGVIGSPNGSDHATPHRSFGSLFRSRGKTMQENGPALGSLKQSQSQSFPRSADEPETVGNRNRRTSFTSGWNVVPSFLSRNSVGGDPPQGNAPAPARNPGARNRRGFNMFRSSNDDPAAIYSDRDPSSPRPVSIASSDLPRPSTESAPFGWPAVDGGIRNSPLATNWSIGAPQPWSRNPSRRPSIQHGSTTALTTGVASEDDEILYPENLAGHSSPPPVGVIGTRPPSSHKPITPKLNPAAPTFKAMFSRTSKTYKAKAKDNSAVPDDSGHPFNNSSPDEARKSRDSPSVHTQNSVADSYDSLERTSSNTQSEAATPSAASVKDKESSFRQLLRKGSSSKFSLSSIRGKDSGLFGNKKVSGSAANSDRNASVEREGSSDEPEISLGKSIDSVTSSPMLGGGGKEKEGKSSKDGRSSNWGRSFIGMKKNKGRESLDIDRSEAETTGTEDEGI
ncbi:hypothetical protein B7494_g8133 [Chlorociboria aeruginascens]|nr:hypothetical protein B7494_g8133 [Chlorociboria aeruginascens]